MINNARALETAYVPQDLEHREGQIDQLVGELNPLVHGLSGEHSFIFGPSGAGKTTLAKFVVRKLQEESFGVQDAYHNCMSASAKTDVLHGLVNDSGLGKRLPKDGVSTSRYLDCIRDSDDHIVAIVDEVDVLDDETTLIGLSELPNVTLVMITIDEHDFFSDPRFEGRVKSRFRACEKIPLRRYEQHELEDILWSRVDAGLKPGVIDSYVVEYIANKAAGDAREAIILLRRATMRVMHDDRSEITVGDVDAVETGAMEEKRQGHIDSLGTHKRLLYDIIKRTGEISASELRSTYEERSHNPRGDTTRGRYLSALENKYDLITSTGTSRGTTYAVSDI
ncbi:orc1/cdc6 family replication initiation protein [Halostagnicola sp. A56]|uniref:Cdc6/Cdc18 family protein n=1 Tax=Halostagnicola sp. A56 TaxID=1495067 RepID=UPI0004A00523|nr:Cdc6/Cdc18 family protein [Halostagnicola sp. A56]KDE56675.1 orc1/cdc6 family replication initiation protein [Halostagnicola sp. A56]